MRKLLQIPALLVVLLAALAAGPAVAQRAPGQDGPGQQALVSAASPNPFKTTAQFSVTVEKAQDVKVEVYNILGQKVQDVFEGRMAAGESRLFTIESRSLPAGLYLYRVQSETGVVSRQITLLR